MGPEFKPLRENKQYITQVNWANVMKQKKRGSKEESTAPSASPSKRKDEAANIHLEAQLKRR